MNQDLPAAIDRLRKAVPRLNQAVDRADQTYADIERFLADECGGAVPVSVEIYQSENRVVADRKDADPGRVEYDLLELAFRRVDGRFRLVFVARTVESYLDRQYKVVEEPLTLTESVRPWDQADRDEKLKGLPALVEMIGKMATIAEALIGSANEADVAMASLSRALQRGAAAGPALSLGGQTLGDLTMSPTDAGVMELVLPGHRRLLLRRGFDRQAIRDLIQALDPAA